MKNSSNDIIGIHDQDGNIICTYNYDAWGNLISIDGNKDIAEINNFRYRSYYFDKETGYYYLKSRYYDSTTGRFLNADDTSMLVYTPDNLNLFSYCRNNPVNYDDQTGHATTKVFIFSLVVWKNESNNIKNDFEGYFSDCEVDVICSNSLGTLDLKWNQLSGYKIVVVSTHGNPLELGNNLGKGRDMDTLTIDEVNNLKYKSVSLLILLGCNAGHWEYKWSNIAHAFSKKYQVM